MWHPFPHEFRIKGTSNPAQPWIVRVGDQVPPQAAQRLRELLCLPRFTILHAVEPQKPADMAVLDDLQLRGYDMRSLRCSIFLKGHGKPRRPRVPPVIPGALILRWGWVDYDHYPDIVGSNSPPAFKRDWNLLASALAGGVSGSAPMRPASTTEAARIPDVRSQLDALGWDFRTLDFRIDMAKPAI